MRRSSLVAGLAVASVLVDYILILRPRHLLLGATDAESDEPLPGDDLVRRPDLVATRAITVHTSADRLWPWIAQLGQGRGGFYSYDLIENVIGCDIHSAERILPQWQEIAAGDEVNLAPEVGLKVALAEPGHALVLHGGMSIGEGTPPYDFTWAFVLKEQPDRTTRLIVRERYAYTRWWAPLLVEPIEVISFVMTQKMLRGIKVRAERTAVRSEALI